MWEAIASNQRRSRILIFLMGVLLIGLGFTIGMAVEPNQGGPIGAGVALILWLILTLTAMFQGDALLLQTAGAREIEKQDCPVLWNVIEEMTIASGGGPMPRVFVIDDNSPNAFAVGRKPENAAIAVTSGLLVRLNRDELQGVVAHEMGHVRNQDIRFMTMAAVMLGAIVMLSEIFLRATFYSGRLSSRGSRRSRGGGNQAQAIMIVVALAAAILAPVFAQILYFACSRKREYLADASSARFTRYPAGLASALEKIAGRAKTMKKTSKVLAPMYIVNPLKGLSAVGIFSTHPPVEKRIQVLRAMGGGAGYMDYESAFHKVEGRGGRLIDKQALSDEGKVAAREATVEPDAQKEQMERGRRLADLFGWMTGMVVLHCDCGTGIQVPPAYQRDTIACPRCGKVHPVPAAVLEGVPSVRKEIPTETAPKASEALAYTRKTTGWETFRCSCGRTIQLSPRFSAPFIRCPECKAKISITGSSS
jgi:heat shock protein HtpX